MAQPYPALDPESLSVPRFHPKINLTERIEELRRAFGAMFKPPTVRMQGGRAVIGHSPSPFSWRPATHQTVHIFATRKDPEPGGRPQFVDITIDVNKDNSDQEGSEGKGTCGSANRVG